MNEFKNDQISIEKKSWYFFRMQELVFEDNNLDSYDKLIYAVISKYSDMDTGICYPSLKTIAEKASCSKDRAIKSIKNLSKAGYLKVKNRRDKEKGNKSNLYKIVDLGYINNVKNYIKETLQDETLFEKLINRLQKHPIPDYEEILTLVYENDKGASRSERQGLVCENDKPSLSDRHELELKNYTKTEEEEGVKIPQKIKQRFSQIFDRNLTVEFYQKMIEYYSDKKIILKALELAEENAKVPKYILDILKDWSNNDLNSLSMIKEYLDNRQAQKQYRKSRKETAAAKQETSEEELNRMYQQGWK